MREGMRKIGKWLLTHHPLFLTYSWISLNLLWLVEQLEHPSDMSELLLERPPTPLRHVLHPTTTVTPVWWAMQPWNLLPGRGQAGGKWVKDTGSIGSVYTCVACLISSSAQTHVHSQWKKVESYRFLKVFQHIFNDLIHIDVRLNHYWINLCNFWLNNFRPAHLIIKNRSDFHLNVFITFFNQKSAWLEISVEANHLNCYTCV